SNSIVVVGAPDDGGVPILGQRDGLALLGAGQAQGGGPNRAGADQLRSLLCELLRQRRPRRPKQRAGYQCGPQWRRLFRSRSRANDGAASDLIEEHFGRRRPGSRRTEIRGSAARYRASAEDALIEIKNT